MAFVEGEGFQGFAALQLTEDIGETGTKGLRIDRVEDFPELRITRDTLDAIDGAEIGVGILAAFVESEQGGILQREQSKASHQGVGEGEAGSQPCVWQRSKTLSQGGNQGIGMKVLAELTFARQHRAPMAFWTGDRLFRPFTKGASLNLGVLQGFATTGNC